MTEKIKVIIVACEGQHDISFITRILHTAGFITDSRKIKDFPSPFNALFGRIAGRMILNDRKLGYQSPNYLLPSVALYQENTIIFLHNLNGDGRGIERKNMMSSYSGLIGEDDFSKDLNYEFRFLFFFDADDQGVESRLSEISSELELLTDLSNGLVINNGKYELGCYIYHDNNSNTGVLEDILLEHFANDHHQLLTNVSNFLSDNSLEIERTKELHIIDGQEKRKGASKYFEKKSKINLFGQLQFSGMNNSVIISKSDFLNTQVIEHCPQCSIIIRMFD